jgi:hypothetical protein
MKWTLPLAAANTVVNLAVSVLIFVMTMDSTLFNPGFLTSFGDLTKITSSELTTGWLWGIKVFAVVFAVICTWDSVEGFIKCRK